MSDFDLRDLDAFVAVARTRNFRRAAVEQGVSVSSLSQRLRDDGRAARRPPDEPHHPQRRADRGWRDAAGPGRTGDGAMSAPRWTRCRGLRGVPSGRLRINAPPPAIDLVLAPMVVPFLRAYPQVDLEIVSDSSFVDIVAGGFDAGVRYGEHLAQDMIAVSLGPPQRYAVVASAQYVAQHGRPKLPKDLLDHPCIRVRFGSGGLLDCEFEKAGRVVKVSPPAKLIANYPGLALRAAHDGVGFWLTFEGYVREGVEIGRAGQRARRLVRAVSRAVFVLPEPASAAARARRVRGFCRGMAEAARRRRTDVTDLTPGPTPRHTIFVPDRCQRSTHSLHGVV